MIGHHPTLSPSSAPAIMQCACFEGGGGDTRDADTGTELHRVTEAIINDDYMWLKNTTLTEGQIECCEEIATQIKTYCEQKQGFPAYAFEQRVEIRNSRGEVISYGTQDVDCPPDLIGDLKSGLDYKPNKIDFKPQMAWYALGRMQERKLEKVTCFEAYIMPGSMFEYEMTYDEAVAMVECVIRRRNHQNKRPQVCYFCRRCARLTHCPAVNKRLKMVGFCYSDEKGINIPYPQMIMNGDEMTVALCFARDILKPYISRLNKIIENIEEAAIALASSGVPIPYFKLGSKNKDSIEDVAGAFKLLPNFTQDNFYSCLKVSIPKIATKYWEIKKASGEKITQKNARKEIEGMLFDVIKTEIGEKTLERDMEYGV